MHVDKIDKYFADRGVKVIYNFLGHTEELVRSYTKKFKKIVENSHRKESQFVKQQCYSELYNLEPRKKFTGFEKHKDIDKNFRKNISPLIHEAQFSPTIIIDPDNNHVSSDYKSELKKFIKTVDNPLLYFSGGIDSELVAMAMLEAEKKFTPVIFNYTNNSGQVLNLFDTNYAFEFCGKNNLFPIIKTINIEELWHSKDFANLAIDLQIVSPQIVTHAYMVELMKNDFPDHTHVFGGEVRFYTYHQLDDGRMANLVLLAKTTPGYNNVVYNAASLGGATPATQYLYYYSDGTWQISGDGSTSWDTDSGTWTTTPASSYEYRIPTNPSITLQQGIVQADPPLATSWAPIGASTKICEAIADPNSPNSLIDVTFPIEVRTSSGAQTNIIKSSTVIFTCEYNA